jgi:hypothetical protein
MNLMERNVITATVNCVAKPAERKAFAVDCSPMAYGMTASDK